MIWFEYAQGIWAWNIGHIAHLKSHLFAIPNSLKPPLHAL